MSNERQALDRIADSVLRALPRLKKGEPELAVGIYRLLSWGEPVTHEKLARELGVARRAVDASIKGWSGIFHDDEHRVIGFWGLSIPETKHRFVVKGRTLYTWCAWDTLFIPGILGEAAEVESACPVTGRSVRLTVSPRGIKCLEPAGTMLSLMEPDARRVRENVIANFCHYVHFFASGEAGRRWTDARPGTSIITPAQGFEIGQLMNRPGMAEAWLHNRRVKRP